MVSDVISNLQAAVNDAPDFPKNRMRSGYQTLSAYFIAGLLCHLFAVPCVAGDAVFSKDGQRIYVAVSGDKKAALREIALSNQTIRTIPLAQLADNDWLRGITRSDDDRIFCITKGSLWSFDSRSSRLIKIRNAPQGANFWRIAYDPKSRTMFVTTDDPANALLMLKNGRELVPVRVRRHPHLSCPVFSSNGELFFGANGDLWHGEVKADDEFFSLTAYRYAPLATLETANTSPAEIGVSDIAVMRDTIYVHLYRMGGSGSGWMAQLARPQLKHDDYGELDVRSEPEHRLALYKGALQSLKILNQNDRQANFCVSPDETRLYYFQDDKHWLVTNGKSQELLLREQ